jgi:hypothetical protein
MVLMRTKVGRAGFKPVDRESDSGSTPSIWRCFFLVGALFFSLIECVTFSIDSKRGEILFFFQHLKRFVASCMFSSNKAVKESDVRGVRMKSWTIQLSLFLRKMIWQK